MRSTPAPTPELDFTVDRAVGALCNALDHARADDPRSIEAVLQGVAALRAAAERSDVDAARFPDLRTRIDGTMARFQRLIGDLSAVRDDVGRELARVRQRRHERRREPPAGGSRLDLTR